MRLHAHAAGLCAVTDPNWRRKLWTLGLWLLVPVLGWPAVLCYRARFVRQLYGSESFALPETNEGILSFASEGLRAVGVIFGCLSPLYAALAVTLWQRDFAPGTQSLALAAFFVIFPIFSTLSFPIACALLSIGEHAPLSGSLAYRPLPLGFRPLENCALHRR